MPRIADHCKGDGWRGKHEPHALVCEWPDSVYVQWGGHGVVIDRKADTARTTAFFEAFPDGGGFIRGEGATVADAERQAHGQYVRETECAHVWARRGYTNGAGLCLKCKAFVAEKFAPLSTLGAWRTPLMKSENDLLRLWDDARERGRDPVRDAKSQRYERKLRLRKSVFGCVDEGKMTVRDHVDMLFGKDV
jgi:hypothetical protein